jgi:hypothetical protein
MVVVTLVILLLRQRLRLQQRRLLLLWLLLLVALAVAGAAEHRYRCPQIKLAVTACSASSSACIAASGGRQQRLKRHLLGAGLRRTHRGDAVPGSPCQCRRQCGRRSSYTLLQLRPRGAPGLLLVLLLVLLLLALVALRGNKGGGARQRLAPEAAAGGACRGAVDEIGPRAPPLGFWGH